MRVIPNEVESRGSADTIGRVFGLAVPHGKPKFRVGGAGSHLMVGVHVDARD